MSDQPFNITREEFEAMHEKYRNLKHDINNTLAVIMALSELAQRNPAHYEKLGKAVLSRSPGVVEGLQEFQGLFTAKLKGGEVPPTAPSSGVF
jgi:hypothetical protein